MGMFDWVVDVPLVKCPTCDLVVEGWQTKSLGCNLGSIPFGDVPYFYGYCDGCQTEVTFTRKPLKLNLDRDFDKVVETQEERDTRYAARMAELDAEEEAEAQAKVDKLKEAGHG